MKRFPYWHLTGVLILLALVARPAVSPADLRPTRPLTQAVGLEGRILRFREPYRIPAGAVQSPILFARQWFHDSQLGAWEAGCRLLPRLIADEDRSVDTDSRYRITRIERTQRPYWYTIELANEDGSRADFNLSCGLTEKEDRDAEDDLALAARVSEGVFWLGSGTPDRWRCFAEGDSDRYQKPLTTSATCGSRAEAQSAALWRCHRGGGAGCHLIPGQCFRLPDHGDAYPLDCEE